MPKFDVEIVETIRYRLVVEAPDAETIEQEDPDTFAEELSNDVGFIGVEERTIVNVHEHSDDEDVDFVLGERVAASDLEEQGDTGGYAPSGEVPIYNVWDDDLNVDEWVYTASEALTLYRTALADDVKNLHVARYREIDGKVHTQEDGVERSLEDLETLAEEEARANQ